MSIKNVKKGFTLIELLVVIAIIGILSGVVLASLNTARTRARDSQRIADTRQVVIALELYFDAHAFYPTVPSPGAAIPAVLQTEGYLPIIPTEPVTGRTAYAYAGSAAAFCFGVDLESAAPPRNNVPNCLAAGASPVKLGAGIDYAVSQ